MNRQNAKDAKRRSVDGLSVRAANQFLFGAFGVLAVQIWSGDPI
jgi:hypothetical protein